MNEKLVAGVVTAAGVGPVCAICVLGPAAVGSMFAGAFAWLGGAGPLLILAIMASAGLLIYRTVRRRRSENTESGLPGNASGARRAKQGERS